jgi:SLAP domain-containing protein
MSIFGGINYNKTFILTTTMLFIFTITLGLLFFVSAVSHQTFAQEDNIYEGLGIKIKYFDPWKMGIQVDDPSCLNMCGTTFSTPDYEATIMIFQDKFDNPQIRNECKCDTLLEYVKYKYEDNISKNEDFVFINDNQTTLTDDNIPAIQMEYEKKEEMKNIIEKSYEILTKAPNSFYRIIFSADKSESYPKYIEDLKKMLNSLEFVSTNETINKPKQPSFMTSEEFNESTSPLPYISDNENENEESALSEVSKALEKAFDKLPESESNELTISSHNSYINSIGHMHVIGEVENNTPNIVKYVQVTATFYGNNNKVVGTSFTFTDPSDLVPGEKAPFDLILTDASIPIEQIEKYTLKLSRQ